MVQLHFTLSELIKSDTADRLKIDNMPKGYEYISLTRLVLNVLEPLREICGHPIQVTSGFRCEALNKAIGGVSNSQHIRGEAADITAGSIEANKRMFEVAIDYVPFDQIILEKGGKWVHISYKTRKENRNQVLYS